MEEAFFCREGRGPGSYRVYSGMGRQVDSKTTHMGYSFGRSMRATDSKAKNPDEKRAANMPGPGDYFSYATAGKEKPAYSFT